MEGRRIEVANVTKRFGAFTAVSEVSLRVDPGEVVCLLGPSGCGKSTLMRMVAGLEEPSGGTIRLGGENVTFQSPERRRVGMVFQNPVVYPKMTVLENVLLPIKPGWFGRTERNRARDMARRAIQLVGLAEYEGRRVEDVGTTVQQRTSVAREIARETGVLVFDEPLTNVGVNERAEFEQSIRRLVKDSGQAAIYVTHDQTEAMTLGDRIAVMSEGKIVQDATPDEVYSTPATDFVAWFIGNPGMNVFNLLRGDRSASGQGGADHRLGSVVGLPAFMENAQVPRLAVSAGFRAEDVEVRSQPAQGFTDAKVSRSAVTVGGRRLLTLNAEGLMFKAKCPCNIGGTLSDNVWIRVPPQFISFFGKDGQRLDLGVN